MGTLSRWKRAAQCGQGMTEYIIIIALIAIAAIGVYSFFGQATRQQPAGAPQELPAKAAKKEATGSQSPDKASAKADQPGSVGDYK